MKFCTFCDIEVKSNTGAGLAGYWNLNNYHGISGTACPECYEKVRHDALGKPVHPEEYTFILLKH